MEQKLDITSIMKFLTTYAAIGQAAMLGMFISGFFIILSLAGFISFNPLVGFITVPVACILFGLRELRK